MKFIRFVRPNRVEGIGAREGFFCAAYELRDDPLLAEQSSAQLEDHLSWFRQTLTIPDKFNRSKSKGNYRKLGKGISWFKDDAFEAIERSFDLVSLLAEHGFLIEILRTEKVGYIVYEDEQQVVAEPFSDTPV